MKKIILLAFVMSVFTMAAKSGPANFEYGIGPNLSLKPSVSYVETPEGRKNGVGVASMPTVGLTAYLPFSPDKRIGGLIDLNYESYTYVIEEYSTGDKFNNTNTYFSIAPQLYFSNFIIGLNIGIPMDIDIEGNDNADTDIMNTSFSLLFGGMFNIYSDETGRIDFFIKGQFMFTGIYDDFPMNDPMLGVASITEALKDDHNPKLGSVMLGFTYMFNLTQK